ncbi:MAG: UTP--glucose-1-phosphate uridylyltransferase GalU [Deltaproteobacteria bacterium]|nr:UTP--glucose-1-phosphate uridylyltransferase GalU [Deltaproteobacteria bacterium]
MKITKAVFPAAGFGTRFLPATKSIPKEMLPVVDKPLIQYCVEEAKASGLTEIIFVTGRGKRAIEDYFDTSVELETILKKKDQKEILRLVSNISEDLQYVYTRQKKPLGLGHAIWCAKNIIGGEPFAVFLSDDIIDSKVPVMKQMLRVFGKHPSTILAVQKVPGKKTHMYGIIKGKKVGPGTYRVMDVVEKPKKNPPSNLAIIGRYILAPEIFGAIENTMPDGHGEIQLTDAIKILLKTQDVYACEFSGERFDAGDKTGFLRANISFALKKPEIRDELRRFMKKLVS